ncbi:MAG: AgmX/PglI C-terminal domain-containing protein [Myxococcales bacterium]|nr:AgmX/PglI C-terminal domain-containing protein [Myxococcales bacterium]
MRGRDSSPFFLLPLALALSAACTPNPKGSGEVGPAGAIPADASSSLPPLSQRFDDANVVRRAPFSLTASDGTGLKVVSMTARAVVDEPLAFTELHLVFENPNDRQIEGRFEIEMPQHAAISRFAMKVHGRWQEGEVVERQAARVAYEDFLHRKQDPALLENNAGNAFSARVFPIGPRERKELIVSYSQELPSSADPYRLMLSGLPELERLDARILVREPGAGASATNLGGTALKTRVIELQKERYMPDRDLEVRAEGARARTGLRHQNLAVARVAASGEMPPVPIGALTVLFDTSASRALGFDHQISRLSQVIKDTQARSGEDFELRVICFDQESAEVYRGKASGFGQAFLDRIASRRAMGASDLDRALRSLAADPQGSTRLVVFSDGIATAGPTELGRLEEAAKALAAAGFTRADAIVDGGIQDTATLKAITTGDLPQDGVVIDARLPTPTIAHKLGSSALPPIKVSVPGAEWVWPETIEGAQPGDELLVYADLPADRAMSVILEGESRIEATVPTAAAERPLLERAWVRARIERLQSQRERLPEGDRDMRDALKTTIIDLSTRHRVLSDFTALLVLETEWDYQRFKIDRNALVDILSVGPEGITLDGRRSALPESGTTLPTSTGREEFAARDQPKDEAKADGESTGLYAMRGPADAVPQMARNFDPEMAARNAGILGDMEKESGHFLASPNGGAFAVGNDDSDVWGGLTGTEVGESFGVGGLGLVGTGRGGGGVGEGTIGIGNTGLIGRGGGGGTGSGYGRGSGAGFGGRGMRIPTVRQAKAEVQGALDKDIIRRIVRAHINEVRACYNQGLTRDPNLGGRVSIHFIIDAQGNVPTATVKETTLANANVGTCIAKAVKRWKFPKPQGSTVIVTYPFVLEPGGGAYTPPTPEELARQEAEAARVQAEWAAREAEERARRELAIKERAAEEAEVKRTEGSPYSGKMFDVDRLVSAGDAKEALALALDWRSSNPGDVLALVAVGEAAEALGDVATAARAYGSLIDLFPARADLRRYAGNRLDRLGEAGAHLAADSYAKAAESRPDHPASHRLLAFALVKDGRHREAWEAITNGMKQRYPVGRFAGVDRILREDAGLIAAAWLRAHPEEAEVIRKQAEEAHVTIPIHPSTRFVISWETDANDVDFHVHDGRGSHAYFADRALPSGGELFADVTTGYGPECFAIDGEAKAFPYRIEAHYYARGPMGYGMGKLQIIQHDGKGELRFDERPYLIMKDRAFVALGTLDKPL